MPTFATPGPITAAVQLAGARVRLTASDRTDTVVLVEPVDRERPKDVDVAERTRVEFANRRLSVKTTASGDENGSVVITIALPSGSGLIAYLAHSSARAEGSFGECELHTASSRVQLDRVDALQANIAGGELTIGRIAEHSATEGDMLAARIGGAESAVG